MSLRIYAAKCSKFLLKEISQSKAISNASVDGSLVVTWIELIIKTSGLMAGEGGGGGERGLYPNRASVCFNAFLLDTVTVVFVCDQES